MICVYICTWGCHYCTVGYFTGQRVAISYYAADTRAGNFNDFLDFQMNVGWTGFPLVHPNLSLGIHVGHQGWNVVSFGVGDSHRTVEV